MKSLLWKEWREHRLIFFLCLAIVVFTRVCLILLPGIRAFSPDTYVLLSLLFSLLFGVVPYTNEFSRQTLPFLLCQPLTKAWIYWTKYLFSLFLLMILMLFGNIVFTHSEFIYLSETYFIHFKYLPFIVIIIYSAAFFASLLLKSSLVTVLATPFVTAIGFLIIFLPLLPETLWKPNQFFMKYIPYIFVGHVPLIIIAGLILFSLLVLLGFLCWYKGISKSKNPLKILGFAIPAMVFIYLIIAVGLLYIFVFGSVILDLNARVNEQTPAMFIFVLSSLFILMGFLYYRKIISGVKYPEKILYLGLALIILLFLIVHTFCNIFTVWELRNAEEIAKKAGIALTMEKIIPPPVSKSENAAPVYEEVFSISERLKGKYSKVLEDYYRVDLKEVSFEERKSLDELIFHDPDFLNMYESLKKAVDMPSCRFNINYEEDVPMEFPYIKMQGVAKMIALKAFILAKEDRYDEALENSMIGLRLGNTLKDEPSYVSQLINISCDFITMRALSQIIRDIPVNCVSVDVYQRLIREIEFKRDGARLKKKLEVTAATSTNRLLKEVLQGQFRHQDIYVEKELDLENLLTIYLNYFGRPMARHDMAFYIKWKTQYTKLYLTPYYRVKDAANRLDKKMRFARWSHPISYKLLRAVSPALLQLAGYPAKLDGLKIALVLKIYKTEKGEYPDSLLPLVPEYFYELPKDPFTGNDFIYRKEGDGFIVYSVGENEKDDGGIYDEKWRRIHDDLLWQSSK